MKEEIKFLCFTVLILSGTCIFQVHAQYEGFHDKNLTCTGPETGDEIQYGLCFTHSVACVSSDDHGQNTPEPHAPCKQK